MISVMYIDTIEGASYLAKFPLFRALLIKHTVQGIGRRVQFVDCFDI